MSDKIKIVVRASDVPGHRDWTETAPRKLTPETHVLQTIVVTPEMPLGDFLRLFSFDDDLGLRFARVSDNCETAAEVEFLWWKEDEITVSIGVRRNGVTS